MHARTADWSGHAPSTILAVPIDGLGELLLTGPAVRALARSARVVVVSGRSNRAVAELLPGVSDIIEFDRPWLSGHRAAVDPEALGRFVDSVRSRDVEHAVIFSSEHQSALPTALALRLSGIRHIAAFTDHEHGTLLDVALPFDPAVHEVERHLQLVTRLGFSVGADQRLAICRRPLPRHLEVQLPERFLVVHPGASAPARTVQPERWVTIVDALTTAGHSVVVTGAATDEGARIVVDAAARVIDLVGRTSISELASVLARARVLCVGHTGVMHLAGAVGTPAVVVFPPTVPVQRHRPWLVQHRLLGVHDIGCAHCRRYRCPLERHPCVALDPRIVVGAVDDLLTAERSPARRLGRAMQRRPAECSAGSFPAVVK
jgi:ADP-heptose:LPS heptosyltransferase